GAAKDGLGRLDAALGPGRSRAGGAGPPLAAARTAAGERYTAAVARLIAILRGALGDDAIVVNDQTGINYWMEWRFPVLAPRTFLYPVGSATLGYGVPAAIGAKIARPERPVICVVGDGGFMYSVNELATAVKYRLPIVFLVMNDDRFGAIKWLQETLFEGRWGEADLTNPDFPALAHVRSARGAPRGRGRAGRSDIPGAARGRAAGPRAADDDRAALGALSAHRPTRRAGTFSCYSGSRPIEIRQRFFPRLLANEIADVLRGRVVVGEVDAAIET